MNKFEVLYIDFEFNKNRNVLEFMSDFFLWINDYEYVWFVKDGYFE